MKLIPNGKFLIEQRTVYPIGNNLLLHSVTFKDNQFRHVQWKAQHDLTFQYGAFQVHAFINCCIFAVPSASAL